MAAQSIRTRLEKPSLERLPDYVDALQRGWSPSNSNPQRVAHEHLDFIQRDAAGFIDSLDDREAKGPPIRVSDGTLVTRLPGFARWVFGDGFCGSFGFRWQRGTDALPDHVLGHIGYTLVPWQRRKGHATAGLQLLLEEVRPLGLASVELTTNVTNMASQAVIKKCGGERVGRFVTPASQGAEEHFRYRITLSVG